MDFKNFLNRLENLRWVLSGRDGTCYSGGHPLDNGKTLIISYNGGDGCELTVTCTRCGTEDGSDVSKDGLECFFDTNLVIRYNGKVVKVDCSHDWQCNTEDDIILDAMQKILDEFLDDFAIQKSTRDEICGKRKNPS